VRACESNLVRFLRIIGTGGCSHFAAHDTSADANTETPTADELRADVDLARVFFAARKKLNEETDRRRRELMERSFGFKQA